MKTKKKDNFYTLSMVLKIKLIEHTINKKSF